MNNIQKKAYTSKEILTIAYPILISLVMVCHSRSILYRYLHDRFRFQYRFADTDGAKERRKEIFRDRRHILSGRVFHDFSGSGRVYSYRVDNAVAASEDTFVAEYLCCCRELYSLEGFRILLLIRGCDVQGFLCWYYSDQDSYPEFACDGGFEHCFQLYSDFR